jgi:nucleotide-binding universal stress UspA family protein
VGDPAQEIMEEAQAGHYRLIILGERQDRRQAPRLLQRSTMLRVVEFAPCSVIVSKGQVNPIRRILLCDSGAESLSTGVRIDPYHKSRAATPSTLSCFTIQLASLLEGETEVTVLHVMSQMSAGPGVRGQQLRAGAHELIQEHTPEGELLARDIQALQRPGIHPRPKVRHGLVVDEILQEVHSENYDLVVIGAHRGERWQRFLLDDLAHQIVLGLDRPVLVVR